MKVKSAKIFTASAKSNSNQKFDHKKIILSDYACAATEAGWKRTVWESDCACASASCSEVI